jgi:hypothetical protein
VLLIICQPGTTDPPFNSGASVHWQPDEIEVPQSGRTVGSWQIMGFMLSFTGRQTVQRDAETSFRQAETIRPCARLDKFDAVCSHGKSFPNLTRPLCPHPTVARYTGGDPNSGKSFVCQK